MDVCHPEQWWTPRHFFPPQKQQLATATATQKCHHPRPAMALTIIYGQALLMRDPCEREQLRVPAAHSPRHEAIMHCTPIVRKQHEHGVMVVSGGWWWPAGRGLSAVVGLGRPGPEEAKRVPAGGARTRHEQGRAASYLHVVRMPLGARCHHAGVQIETALAQAQKQLAVAKKAADAKQGQVKEANAKVRQRWTAVGAAAGV